MASLIKGLKFASQLTNRNPAVVASFVRHHWNKDFKPAKFPVTQKEKDASAEKYQLLPEEYKPFADDGMGYGDYPKLPDVGVEQRDAFYPYDFPEHRRNYNEPVHAEIDLYNEDRFSFAEKPRYEVKYQWLTFLSVMAGILAFYYWLDDKKMFRPVLPRQYARDGKPHYTFEKK